MARRYLQTGSSPSPVTGGATELATTGVPVSVQATPPNVGDVVRAVSATQATWQPASNLIGITDASNTALGDTALDSLTSGAANVGIGHNALTSNTTGGNNVAVGQAAGLLVTGGNNTFIGATAGDATTTGTDNIVVGFGEDTSAAGASNEVNLGGVLKSNSRTTGQIEFKHTNTAVATTGAQTIDNPSGTVNFAAAATTLVVTNSTVTATSLIFVMMRTADATAILSNMIVPGAGSFTITMTVAPTAETSVGFLVIN